VECHSGGPPVTVIIDGPTTVSPESNNRYILTIRGDNVLFGGFDVSTTGGLLSSSDPDSQRVDGELTHFIRKEAVDGIVTFAFDWTAPSTPGKFTIYAAGNSVNGNSKPEGDNSNITNLEIEVESSGNNVISPSIDTITITNTRTITSTSTITSTPAVQTITSTVESPPITVTSTTTITSEIVETEGYPAIFTFLAIAVAIISLAISTILVMRKK
jgi:hypothetical protein